MITLGGDAELELENTLDPFLGPSLLWSSHIPASPSHPLISFPRRWHSIYSTSAKEVVETNLQSFGRRENPRLFGSNLRLTLLQAHTIVSNVIWCLYHFPHSLLRLSLFPCHPIFH